MTKYKKSLILCGYPHIIILIQYSKRELLKIIKKLGYQKSREGKHEIWEKLGFKSIPVPRHKGDIPKGTVEKMLKDAGVKK